MKKKKKGSYLLQTFVFSSSSVMPFKGLGVGS